MLIESNKGTSTGFLLQKITLSMTTGISVQYTFATIYKVQFLDLMKKKRVTSTAEEMDLFVAFVDFLCLLAPTGAILGCSTKTCF